jgi:transcriptional regulator with XRE-family HTH domain
MTPAEKADDNSDLAALGQFVRQHRLAAGLTQEGLADVAGLHWTYVSDVERGRRNPTYRVIRQLARALGVAPGDLFPS